MLTHLERYQHAVRGEAADRAPLAFSATPEMMQVLQQYLGAERDCIVYDFFGVDMRSVGPRFTGPPDRKHPDGTWENLWGVRQKRQNYAQGTYEEAIGFPLAGATSVHDVENHAWPSPEWYEYGSVCEAMAQYPEYPFNAGYAAIGWWSWELRGMQQFLQDLLTEPTIAEAVIAQVADFATEYYRRLIEAGRDCVGRNWVQIHLADDWATQRGLLISPSLYRRFFKAAYRRIIDMAHAAGLLVEFHCCGSVVDLVPELIDTGIDILNPIQTSAAGMLPQDLKRRFGEHLAFSGGVDVQTVLPFGTPSEVRMRVNELLDTLGSGGRYILGPSHAIQVGTPPENVVAMFEAAHTHSGVPFPLG
ncbi:MAG: uroporphyrinogen decarboxylase family protein [Anaerolineae bacterium]